MEKHVHSLLGVSIDKIKEMVDVNTVVGNPIKLDDGVTLIPVSRIAYGFASGGSDLPNKADRDIFGGGSGAGVNVTPVAFLVIKDGDVRMMPINATPNSIDRAVSMVPDMVDKVVGVLKKQPAATEAVSVSEVDEIVLE